MLRCFLVDAFAQQPFAGNPAGVCLVSGSLDDATRQRIAAELNQVRGAFVQMHSDVDCASGMLSGR